MLEFFKNNYSLYISIFLLTIGLGFQQSFIAPLGANVNIDEEFLNYIVNVYYVGFLAGVYIVPKLIEKVGYVRSFSILATTFSAIFMGFALFQEPLVWLGLRLVSGFCFSGLYLITESWINSSIENNNRGNAISLYLSFMFAGILTGNYLTRFLEGDGLRMLAMTSFMLSLAFIPVLLMRFEPKKILKNQKMSLKELYQASPMGTIGVLFIGVGYGLNAMLSVYISGELNATTLEVSNFLVLGAIISLPATYLIGKFSDKVDRRIVILSLSFVAITGSFIFSMQSSMGLMIYVSYIILSIGLHPLYSICTAHTNDWLDHSKRVPAAAKLGLTYGIGSIFGGILTSTLITFFNAKVLVWVQIIVYTTLMLFTLYRYLARGKSEDTSKFVAVPSRAGFGLNIYKSKKKN